MSHAPTRNNRTSVRFRPEVTSLEDRVVLSASTRMARLEAKLGRHGMPSRHRAPFVAPRGHALLDGARGPRLAMARMARAEFLRGQVHQSPPPIPMPASADPVVAQPSAAPNGPTAAPNGPMATPAQSDPADMVTFHNGPARQGANLNEEILNPQNVNTRSFGKLWRYPVDGQVFAQPLYIGSLSMSDGIHNVVFAATENDSVYALDADDPQAGPNHDGVLWKDTYVDPARGITAVPSQDLNSQDLVPAIGITGTPVIDPDTGTLYVVTKVKVQPQPNLDPHYVQQLHALDIATGAEKLGGPVTIGDTTLNQADGTYTNITNIAVPGTGSGSEGGVVRFNAMRQFQRPALVLDKNVPGAPNGVVFIGWAGHGDIDPNHGWLVGYDAKTLQMFTMFNTTPDGNHGAIWASGGAPAVDDQGNLFVTTGDGSFDAFADDTPPGPHALGDTGFGLGYTGISDSAALVIDAADETGFHSATGLHYNGVFPSASPLPPNEHQDLDRTLLNLPEGGHNYRATLSYDGSTLSERIEDLTTHATFTHDYHGVDLPATVDGDTAWVGFSGGADGRRATWRILNWTYSSNGSTVIDHSSGFSTNGDLTANGDASFQDGVLRLTDGGFDDAGTSFATDRVNVTNFTTTFTFAASAASSPLGDGIAFVIQAAKGHPFRPNYSDSVLKLQPTPGQMTVADSFTPSNFEELEFEDRDLGSTGPMLLPDFPDTAHPHLLVQASKTGDVFLLDRDHLGGIGNPLQTVKLGNTGVWGNPAFFNDTIYYQAVNDVIKGIRLQRNPDTNTMELTEMPVTQGDKVSAPRGTTPSISALGETNGIAWALQVDRYNAGGQTVVRAYDANDLSHELYESQEAFDGALDLRDLAGPSVKFVTPTIANGHVYVPAQHEVDVFGLFPAHDAPPAGPAGLNAAADAIGPKAQLTWNNTFTNDATGIMVFRSTDGEHFQGLALLSPGTGSFTDAEVSRNTKYFYMVAAINQAGDSRPSNQAVVTT